MVKQKQNKKRKIGEIIASHWKQKESAQLNPVTGLRLGDRVSLIRPEGAGRVGDVNE